MFSLQNRKGNIASCSRDAFAFHQLSSTPLNAIYIFYLALSVEHNYDKGRGNTVTTTKETVFILKIKKIKKTHTSKINKKSQECFGN